MVQINFKNVSFQYIKPLFTKATFGIGHGDRIGIVGANGCGKSTLLDCIRGVIQPNSGKITQSQHIKFGFVPQEIPKQLYKKKLYQALTDALPEEDNQSSSIWQVDALLDQFEASHTIRQQPIEQLSGGWKQITMIAHTILGNPDIILFDEPTNHLDMSKIMLLEKWLNNVVDIPMVAVSHDRQFLANCTNKTLFINNESIEQYNYSYQQAMQLHHEKAKNIETQRINKEKEIIRIRKSAHALSQISTNNHSIAAANKARFMYQRADQIEKNLPAKHHNMKRDINLSYSSLYSSLLIHLKKISITAPSGTFLFKISQLDIVRGDRIVILGENGSGKSMLLQYVHQHIKNQLNERAIKIGYLTQHTFGLELKSSAQEYISQNFSLEKTEAIRLLHNAGFPIELHKIPLSELSPGQRKRVALLELYLLKPNFYIMDEPTNHLDITGQQQLEAKLIEANTTAIIVSHDRAFAKKIGTKIYTIQDNQLCRTQLSLKDSESQPQQSSRRQL